MLRGHCERVGRNYDEIVRSTGFNVYPIAPGVDGEKATAKLRQSMNNMSYEAFAKDNMVATVDEIGERVQSAIEAGADYGIIYIPGVAYDHDLMHRFEEGVIAKLGSLTAV